MSVNPVRDAVGFRGAFEQNYRVLLAYALRRTSCRSDAEDVVGETFTVAWRRVDKLPVDEEGQRLWLYGIARRILSNQHRSNSRDRRLNDKAQALEPVESPAADAGVEDDSDVATALDVLTQLGDADRELVALAFWEELSSTQIAKVVGTSTANVSVRLHRAKKRLEKLYQQSVQETPTAGHVSSRRATTDRAREQNG